MRHGRYYVKGKLIHQTDFARDPEFPRTSSNVLEMLGPSAKHRVTVSRLDQQFPGTGIILGEVSSPVDLREWASRCSPNILPAGGAEFFAALLKTIAPAKRRASSPAVIASRRPRGSRELFICGSTSDSTRKFVSEAKSNGTPVFFVLDGAGEGFSFRACAMESMAQEAIRAFGSHSRVVLAIGRPLIERRAVAHRLARCLAEVAVLVLGKASPGHIYAEGGATAAELVRRLEWKRMGVMRELAPGVTTLGLPNRESPLLTIKPGSYAGWPK
jgi:uncharacterized protein YgbK (DUF1537 family)